MCFPEKQSQLTSAVYDIPSECYTKGETSEQKHNWQLFMLQYFLFKYHVRLRFMLFRRGLTQPFSKKKKCDATALEQVL